LNATSNAIPEYQALIEGSAARFTTRTMATGALVPHIYWRGGIAQRGRADSSRRNRSSRQKEQLDHEDNIVVDIK